MKPSDHIRFRLSPIHITLLFAVVAVGGFHAWSCAIAGTVLLIYLAYLCRVNHGLQINLNPVLVALVVLLLGYGLSTIWAVDRGMAGFGAVKMLPVVLFAVVLMQFPHEQEEHRIFRCVPWIGAAMTILSLIMQFVPGASAYVFINGRLCGTFQYANTYALFLLIGCAVLLFERERDRWSLILGVILVIGIAASGSRTSAALLALLVIVFAVHSRKLRYIALAICTLAAAAVIALLLSRIGAGGAVDTSADTLRLRLRYFRDALPVIASHPFGLGYLGYKSLLSSFQTGAYSVRFIHNELLQLLLDVGWIPTALLCFALIRSFFRKGKGIFPRMVLLVILGHAMMDFDLQYLSIWLLVIPAMDVCEGKPHTLKKGTIPLLSIAAVLMAVSLWLGAGDALYQAGDPDGCLRVVPFHTEALTDKLHGSEDVAELETWAGRVLAVNDSSAEAHSAKGDGALARGDVGLMINEKERAIALAPYQAELYRDYMDRLYRVMSRYLSSGDTESAGLCREILMSLPGRMQSVGLELTGEEREILN